MKRLIVFRHAKSDWGAESQGDHERPLNERGRVAARRMGRFLAGIDQVPERVLVSSALRARTTLELAIEAGAWECAVDVSDDLYATTAEAALVTLRAESDSTESLLWVGHQPTWSELVALLSGGSPPAFPSAAMARVDLGAERWRDVAPGGGQLAWLVTPKLVKGAGAGDYSA